MGKTLYLTKYQRKKDGKEVDGPFFGVTPPQTENYDDYYPLKQKISLKDDLGWAEVQDLRPLFEKAGIWENFPAESLEFIFAEMKAGDEDQRIDILYLRDDGGLYPCELKIGGAASDPHGQLIRYMSDLHYQQIDCDWLLDKREDYLRREDKAIPDPRTGRKKLRNYLRERKIEDRHLHVIEKSGIIIDENFRPQVLKTVRYLNELCGFSIRLLRMETYVDETWDTEDEKWYGRVDIVEVQ